MLRIYYSYCFCVKTLMFFGTLRLVYAVRIDITIILLIVMIVVTATPNIDLL